MNGKTTRLSAFPFTSSPTHAADEFEAMFDLARFGVRRGNDVTVQFGGSDSLDQPVQVKMADNAELPVRRSWKRTQGTDIRIASLNTQNEGLAPRNGFVLDTAELNEDECRRLGVRAEDSLVSDYLLLVADFGLGAHWRTEAMAKR